jgi:small ligand-binding sensory domain FIST
MEPDSMKWASHLSTRETAREAVAELAGALQAELGGGADLSLLFVSPHYRAHYDQLSALVQEHLPSGCLIGCSAGGVIGGGHEVEQRPAMSLTAATLPGVRLTPLYSDTLEPPDDDAPPGSWRAWLGLNGEETTHFIILADPFSTAIEGFLAGLDYAYPAGAKIGGLASGARQPGDNALFLNGRVHRQGLVAVALRGNLQVDTIVAQGCRPIGRPAAITRCQQNILLEIDRRPPLKYLEQLLATLSESDRKLMRTSLFLGLAIDPLNKEPAPGDFLIRNLVGVDYQSGAVSVGALLHDGQTVQFHLRDRMTSAEDLQKLLTRYARSGPARDARGALLFSCLGRGEYLYGQPDHDSRAFQNQLGALSLGGFFCNGEIGPVGGATYIHGYTSAFGIFKPLRT